MKRDPSYSIEVYDDCAIIRGWLTAKVLTLLIRLCCKEGFTHMDNIGDGTQGFKLVKKNEN